MLFLTISIFFSLTLIKTPIQINIIIILTALLISIIMCLFNFSWFRFIIFLLYIGGILVIFIYFSTLIPNQTFYFKPFIKILLPRLITVLYISPPNKLLNITICSTIEARTIIRSTNIIIYINLIIFLFIMLLVVVKITTFVKRPIRPLIYALPNTKISPPFKNYK